MDRLPWLPDEPKPQTRPKRSARELLGWAFAALFLIAGVSYWMGVETGRSDQWQGIAPGGIGSTVKLPEARTIAPDVLVDAAPAANSKPSAELARPHAQNPAQRQRVVARKRKLSPMDLDASELSTTVARQQVGPAKVVRSVPLPSPRPLASRSQLRLWPATQSNGAYGRLVRIGAFGSRQQAKLGWRRMQRAYPAVGRLPAAVVTDRNSRGRVFYRFQIGTTSQAHSEVLCQRMQKIRFSCAVLGLPWKAKIER
ncbi:MAG: hypothetical protein ACJ8FL_03615 [Sphingomicrobium sp.]